MAPCNVCLQLLVFLLSITASASASQHQHQQCNESASESVIINRHKAMTMYKYIMVSITTRAPVAAKKVSCEILQSIVFLQSIVPDSHTFYKLSVNFLGPYSDPTSPPANAPVLNVPEQPRFQF